MANLHSPVAPESQPETRPSRSGPWPPALLGALAAFALMWSAQKSPGFEPAPPAQPPPAPAAVAPAPPAPPVLANALPDATSELTPPRQVPPRATSVVEVTLGQAWLCYSQGNFEGARRLALVSLEATRHGSATPEHVAQATALIELCRQAETSQPTEEVVLAPEPQAVPPVPQAVPAPVELPRPDYPVAARRSRSPQPVRQAVSRTRSQPQGYPYNQVYQAYQAIPQAQVFWPGAQALPVNYSPPQANWGQPVIPGWQPSYTPPGGGQAIPYPAGRGPGVCPNYAVEDRCACHVWEGQQRAGQYRPRSQPVSEMTRRRQAESLLGRGGF